MTLPSLWSSSAQSSLRSGAQAHTLGKNKVVPSEYVLHNRVYAMCKIAHYKFNACNSHAAHCFWGLTISSLRFVGICSHFSFKDPPQYISSAKVWTLTDSGIQSSS